RRGHQDTHDGVLVLVVAAELFRLLQRSQRPGPLVAVLAVAEDEHRVRVLLPQGGEVEIVAGDVVPELGAAAEAQADQAGADQAASPAPGLTASPVEQWL